MQTCLAHGVQLDYGVTPCSLKAMHYVGDKDITNGLKVCCATGIPLEI